MRFIQAGTMLLGTVIYVGFFLGWYRESMVLLIWAVICFNALVLIVTVLVTIDSRLKIRASETRQLATGVFITKLAAIPLFVGNFAMLALGSVGGAATLIHGVGLAILGIVAIGTALNYVAMLSTSVYGWAAIVALRREGRIGRVLAVLYTILLFVFVADTVAGILLFAHSRRGRVARLT